MKTDPLSRTLSKFQSVLDSPFLTNPDPTRLAFKEIRPGLEDVAYTQTEFALECRKIAGALTVKGVQKDDIVLVVLERTSEICLCFWALLLLGATPLVYPTRTPRMLLEVYEENLKHLHSQVEAAGIIGSEDAISSFTSLPQTITARFEELQQVTSMPASLPKINPSPSDIIHLQTSSGTTGRQKIVPLTHQNVINQMKIFSGALDIRQDDVVVNWMPYYHDGGLMFGLLLPFTLGIPTITMSPIDWVVHPSMLFEAISKHKGTLSLMPNSAFSHCERRIRSQDLKNVSLESLRHLINGAERVYFETMQKFYERFSPFGLQHEALVVAYGMAENTLVATFTPNHRVNYDELDAELMSAENIARPFNSSSVSKTIVPSCGSPLDGIQVTIRDENFKLLPERSIGEICLRSSSMFSAYFQRPDLTEQHFREGWYVTGDLGYLFKGELFITGRKRDLIINGGKNIYPSDIEEVVYSVSGVRPGRAAAFGIYDSREGTELITIVAETTTTDPAEQSEMSLRIREAVASQTPVVASYVHVTAERWIIKTSSGKIARAANREKWLTQNQL